MLCSMFDGGVLCVSQISHNVRSRWLSSHERRIVVKHTRTVVKPNNGFSAFLLSWKALYSEVYALLCKSYDIRYLSTNHSKRDSRGYWERERGWLLDSLSLCYYPTLQQSVLWLSSAEVSCNLEWNGGCSCCWHNNFLVLELHLRK